MCGFTDFERSEARQDITGKNLLAAAAPQTLTKIGLAAVDKELDRRMLQEECSPGMLKLAATTSPMYRDRNFRTKFTRAERMNASKAALRLTAYLTYAAELFGQEALFRSIPTTVFTAMDEQVLRAGWMQLLLTRDQIGRRVVAFDDLGPVNLPLVNKVSLIATTFPTKLYCCVHFCGRLGFTALKRVSHSLDR